METVRSKARARVRARLPRALVIEPNATYRSVIAHVVELAGGQFETVAELEQGKRQLDGSKRFDVVIVGSSADDPVTPEAISQFKAMAQSPLIFLAEAFDETRQTLEVFQAGAGQVLPKPFVPDALVGAIKAEINRSGPASLVPLATRIELGSLAFDAAQRSVSSHEGTATLTRREWQLLAVFLASPNQFFSSGEVALQAWGPDASVEQFRSYIARIRQKLARFRAYCSLVTEKGRGYCLVVAADAITPAL